jgi:hypothetical protein
MALIRRLPAQIAGGELSVNAQGARGHGKAARVPGNAAGTTTIADVEIKRRALACPRLCLDVPHNHARHYRGVIRRPEAVWQPV